MLSKKSVALPRKRTVYIFLSMLLGFLLGNLIYTSLAVSYPEILFTQEDASCMSCRGTMFDVYPLQQMIFTVLGTIGGYFMGGLWWQVVYVDRKYRNKDKSKTLKTEW